ncbi:hypothetical protein [Methylocystis parvus]|uniref:Pam3-gp28 family putative phage holin n=1 Tax=Methylocystis parvus TaxID=134 RepID=UPI003C72C9D4
MDKVIASDLVGALVRNLGMPLLMYLAARGFFPAEAANDFLAGVVSLTTFVWGLVANRAPDGAITRDKWANVVRNLGAPWVAYAIGKGWVTSEIAEWFVAGVSSISFAAWSVYDKRRLAAPVGA